MGFSHCTRGSAGHAHTWAAGRRFGLHRIKERVATRVRQVGRAIGCANLQTPDLLLRGPRRPRGFIRHGGATRAPLALSRCRQNPFFGDGSWCARRCTESRELKVKHTCRFVDWETPDWCTCTIPEQLSTRNKEGLKSAGRGVCGHPITGERLQTGRQTPHLAGSVGGVRWKEKGWGCEVR